MMSVVLSLALASALAQPEPEVVAIDQLLDGLHQSASRADGTAYFDAFTPQARFIGTDATEHWGLEAFKAYAMPYFSKGQGWTYHPSERVVTITDNPCRCVAWFDEQLDNANYGRLRGSGVLSLTPQGWKIEQYVLSLAVPNERSRAVVDVIKQAD